MERLKWCLMQLLPFMYVTTFTGENGRRRLVVWRMWLGHSFDIRYFDLGA